MTARSLRGLSSLIFTCIMTPLMISAVALATESAPGDSASAELDAVRIDLLYRNAQRAFQRGEFQTALPQLQRYIQVSADYEIELSRFFGVIDQIAQIYIREMRDPDRAIGFFSRIDDDPRLTSAQRDAVRGWIGAAQDWKTERTKLGANLTADDLFKMGTRYYNRARRTPGSPAARGDLIIATRYLLQFIREHDGDPRIGEVLYMMGYAASYKLTDPEYWSENQYLTRAITRFPHSELARRAWQRLHDSVHARYKRTGHDQPPPSILEMLEMYRRIAAEEE